MSDFNAIRFLSGRPLLKELGADRLNTILTEIKRNRPKGERGITVRQDGTGTYIGLAASLPRGASTPTTNHPFQIRSFADPEDDSEDPDYVFTVYPGTINNLLPTNILDEEQLVQFSLPKNSLRYVVLDCVAASNALTSCAVAVETDAPALQTPLAFALPTEYQVVLGIVYNSTVYQMVQNNLSVSGRQAYITDKNSPTPGSLPYNVFLQWG